MADHHFVELAVNWLNNEWDTANYPGSYSGSTPAIVDGDDAESTSWNGRKVAYDLSKNNAVIVSSSPARQQDIIGTEFDYRFDDGVSIRVVAAHDDQVNYPNDSDSPGVTGSAEFRALYQEVRRILHNHWKWPDRNQSGDQHTDTLWIEDETNLSPQYKDLFEYDITASVRGFEELP